MIQRAQSAFKTASVNPFVTLGGAANLIDQTAGSSSNGWTGGATIIERLSLQPPNGAQWQLLGVGVSGMLVAQANADPGKQVCGKLGKIQAGIVPQITTTTENFPLIPFTEPMLPLPIDSSLLFDLWDPASDPLPPSAGTPSAASPMLAVSGALQLPQPIPFQFGSQIGIGMWMNPSLIGQAYNGAAYYMLCLCNSLYTIYYDDGKPAPAVFL
jgi:hypothetical protein